MSTEKSSKTYQVKDIPDEQVYSAILAHKAEQDHYYRSVCLDYDELSSTEKIRLSAHMIKLRMSDVEGLPPYPEGYVYDYIDAPDKVVLRKMQKMVDQKKLEYGVSLRTAWINEA